MLQKQNYRRHRCVVVTTLLLFGHGLIASAGTAQWSAPGPSGNWNSALDWTPKMIPNGPGDSAVFGFSKATAVSTSADTQIGKLTFNPGASSFTITPTPGTAFTIGNPGIINNSGITQNFLVTGNDAGLSGQILFQNSASAGNGMMFVANGATVIGELGGLIGFANSSKAGTATFVTNAPPIGSTIGGYIFGDSATADHGTFVTNGGFESYTENAEIDFPGAPPRAMATLPPTAGPPPSVGGIFQFFESARAGNGVFTTNGGSISSALGGDIIFNNTSTADHGIFITTPVSRTLVTVSLYFIRTRCGQWNFYQQWRRCRSWQRRRHWILR